VPMPRRARALLYRTAPGPICRAARRRALARRLPILVLVIGFAASLASAQNPADCNKAYDSMLQRVERQGSQLAAERLLALRRRAQRILDACRTGHIEDPRALFVGSGQGLGSGEGGSWSIADGRWLPRFLNATQPGAITRFGVVRCRCESVHRNSASSRQRLAARQGTPAPRAHCDRH